MKLAFGVRAEVSLFCRNSQVFFLAPAAFERSEPAVGLQTAFPGVYNIL